MGFKYEANNPEGIYFTTSTIIQWIDLFTRRELQEVVIDSLKYCQREKGLIIFAWSLMPSHLHMISAAKSNRIALSDIMRDFKKHTSKALVKTISEINESRSNWLMSAFEFAGRSIRKIKDYKVWQDGYHPEEIITQPFMDQKLHYIHYNAVEAGFVTEPHPVSPDLQSGLAENGISNPLYSIAFEIKNAIIMGFKYEVNNPEGIYFTTSTIVQ